MFRKIGFYRGMAYIFTSLLFVTSATGTALEANRNVVDGFLGTKSSTTITEGGDEELWTTYTADYSSTDALVETHRELGKELEQEGAVLLKNNGSLPFDQSVSKVTLLGLKADAKTYYGATIGVSVNDEQNVSLTDALEEKGISVNKTVNDSYGLLVAGDDYKGTNKLSPSFSGYLEGSEPVYQIKEPTISELKSADSSFESSIAGYKDAAIVVIGRPGSEAADYYPGSTGVDQGSGARNPLALSDEEKDLIAYAGENFDKVVVLINSANTMELGDLENNDNVDAILWIGFPGNFGMNGVADVLCGDVSPSGALPDIYASDSTSSPAMANFGVISFSNASQYLTTDVDRGDFYLVEAEGIYTGYRYYETRYADTVMGRGNAASVAGTFDSKGAWNYQEEVVYPFGFGLSYTTFEKTLDSLEVDTEGKTITASVTVKNTGSSTSKTSVQLYGQAPYIEGGLEKSAVVLAGFEKTSLLEPGASETITVTADLEVMTSYDENDSESYVLDAGSYFFTVADGTHDAINNILSVQGYTSSDGMDADGNKDAVKSWEFNPEGGRDTDLFKTTEAGATVSNQLQDADLNTWIDDEVTYLSRSDWEGTWPKTYDDVALTEDMLPYLKNNFYEIKTGEDTSAVTYNANNKRTFAEMKLHAYDDPAWDELLDQLDLQEALNFITQGNRTAPAMESIGFTGGQYTENGPGGFNNALSAYSNTESPWYVSETDANAAFTTNDTGCAPLFAATFNKELVKEFGVLWGNDSLYNGLPFIWAPGLNLHRTPYNGRNVEYYSEDPVLAGTIGMELITGGLSKGLIMAPKHFAFNDQESNRNGIAPFMTEQKARELELRSFQIAVENGCLGLMTSFSRIGVTYVGAHKGLLQGILKNEWGFNGYVVSDMVNPGTYMTWKESVIAGTTNFDAKEADASWSSYLTADTNNLSGDAQMIQAVRERLHSTLYVFANSNMINGINSSSKHVELNTWWRIAYKAGIVLSAVITILSLAGYCLCMIKRRKEA